MFKAAAAPKRAMHARVTGHLIAKRSLMFHASEPTVYKTGSSTKVDGATQTNAAAQAQMTMWSGSASAADRSELRPHYPLMRAAH